MSIREQPSGETIVLNTINAMAFKVLIWIGIVATPAGFAMLWNHSSAIALHEFRLDHLERQASRGSGVSQSVNVGQASKEMAKSGMAYLTVAKVAEAEGVAERTITDWISKGRIVPLPVKHGKEYTISADYRILPQDAACCGDETALSANEPNKPNPTQTHEPTP